MQIWGLDGKGRESQEIAMGAEEYLKKYQEHIKQVSQNTYELHQ